MENDTCILLVSGLRPFASKLYDLKSHPRYGELFEPWNKEETQKNYYDHVEQRKLTKEVMKQQNLLNELGLDFAKVDTLRVRDLNDYETRQFEKKVILTTKTITDELLENL